MENQKELLTLLNQFTRREHTLDEVYMFDLVLCDNEIDRDGDAFSDAALDALAKCAVGVTGIFDHNPKSGNQTARIFRTEVCTDAEKNTKTGAPYRFLKANAYMVRTDGNADLIREIDAGIKKEVSVSCAVSKQICSICGANRIGKPCRHLKGKHYGEKLCYHILDGVTDMYEWSFVAVPAQPRAGVTKTFGALNDYSECDLLRRELAETDALIDRMTEAMRRDVVRLCYKDSGSYCAKILADAVAELDINELISVRESLMQASAGKSVKPQLSFGDLSDYSTGKGAGA